MWQTASYLSRPLRSFAGFLTLPPAARLERRRDLQGLPVNDCGPERAIDEAIGWLCRAQDHSASADGGVARHYSLTHGWGPSYPETTGYIIPTMIAYAKSHSCMSACKRAKKMLDWLASIQLSDGSFAGGSVGANPVVSVTFNTGQILIGLAAGVAEFGEYHEPMCRAADWLVNTQNRDGCWRKYPSPFASPGEKTYDSHAAWGLLEAARLEPRRGYQEAGLANVRWSLRYQHDNGWIEKCCLTDPGMPLTHTLGYALRGILEAYRFSRDTFFLESSRRTAEGLITVLESNGFLPGRLLPNWIGAVRWACLTGTAQIAYCWMLLHRFTGEARYRHAACAANQFLRRTQRTEGPEGIRGGIKGSFPVHGEYSKYQLPNWACKFFLDSNMAEQDPEIMGSSFDDSLEVIQSNSAQPNEG